MHLNIDTNIFTPKAVKIMVEIYSAVEQLHVNLVNDDINWIDSILYVLERDDGNSDSLDNHVIKKMVLSDGFSFKLCERALEIFGTPTNIGWGECLNMSYSELNLADTSSIGEKETTYNPEELVQQLREINSTLKIIAENMDRLRPYEQHCVM